MDRLVLSDAAWGRMAPLIIGRPDQKGSTGRDNRMFVEGVLWIVRTGSPWRDLTEAFGDWNSVFRRFSRWSTKGGWWRIFEAMSDDPDFEYLEHFPFRLNRRGIDRDRGTPRDAAPPAPPGRRVRTTAVRPS
jgi:transposase